MPSVTEMFHSFKESTVRYLKQFADPSRAHILFLVPLANAIMDEGDDPMTREAILKGFPGNTVVAELAVGTSYAYVERGGIAKGLHPTYGKLTGAWNIDEDGVVCVTWPLPNDNEIENCSKTIDLGKGRFNWANQVIRLEAGDIQTLGN